MKDTDEEFEEFLAERDKYDPIYNESGGHLYCLYCNCVYAPNDEINPFCDPNSPLHYPCDINSLKAVSQEIAETLEYLHEQIHKMQVKDDGTLLRIGGVAIGISNTVAGLPKKKWFIKRYKGGKWRRTSYGNNLVEAIKRSLTKI